MNIKTTILLCCMLTLPALRAGAAIQAAPDWAGVRAKVDAIDMANIGLEAHYWAWRIDKVKDVTYDSLLEKSARWIGSAAYKQKLFARIKERLANSPVPALNAQQRRTMDAYKNEIRKLLSPGSYDQAAIKQVTPDYCIELKARYWARRVQQGENEILDLMQNWGIMDRELKQRLLTRIEERVKLENAPLTAGEMYKYDACKAVIK